MTDDPFGAHRSLLFTAPTRCSARLPTPRTSYRKPGCDGRVWVAEDVELAESVSIAMLTVLETLGPIERAVFVLREVFETPYDEIAEAVGKTPTTVRQIAHRARQHVAARRLRVRVSRAEQETVVERFLAAVRDGDMQELLEVLAPEVVVLADGGGVVTAALRPIEGAHRVAAFLGGLARKVDAFEVTPMWLNGGPAMRVDVDAALDTVASLVVEDGRITRIYAIRNPYKLARLDEEAELSRSVTSPRTTDA